LERLIEYTLFILHFPPAGSNLLQCPEITMIRKPVKRVTPIILAATALLLLLDVIGELAGKPLGFPYPALGVVSLLIYVGVGALGAWRANFAYGLLAAAMVGLLDATLGPLAAWLVGNGPLGQEVTEPRVFAYSITVVTATATAAGLLGAVAGSWLERRRGLRGSRVVPR
jgi:hypothetical protein